MKIFHFSAVGKFGKKKYNINLNSGAQICVIFSLSPRPVATNILNDKKLAPVHLATELNKVKGLQVMGKYRETIDIQQGGEHGRTALHLAAIYDHEECARILVSVSIA